MEVFSMLRSIWDKNGVLEIALEGAVLVAEATQQQAKTIPVEVRKPVLATAKA
jgi:hypothetical protein